MSFSYEDILICLFSCSHPACLDSYCCGIHIFKLSELKLKLKLRRAAEEGLLGVSRPKLLPNTEYIVASGLRLVDLGVVRSSFGNAAHVNEQR